MLIGATGGLATVIAEETAIIDWVDEWLTWTVSSPQ